MTATNARMFRVRIGENDDDSILMSQAEIDQMMQSRALHARQEALAAAASEEAEPTELPDFNASDAEILANQQKGAAKTDKPPPPRQALIIGAGGVLVALLLVALSSLSWRGQGAGPLLAPATVAVPSAAPATAPPTAPPTVIAPETTVGAYFDYHDPASSTEITTTGMLRVEAKAGDAWRLIALSAGRPQVWVKAEDVPAGLAVADPLRDLSPVPTRAPQAAPANSGGVATPAQCLTDADVRFTKVIVVTYQRDGEQITRYPGTVTGKSCYSQAEADQNADAWAKAMIAQDMARTPPQTPPTATDMPLMPPTSTPSR